MTVAITTLDHTENDSKDKMITQINANFAALAASINGLAPISSGTVTLNGATPVAVANTAVTASSQIQLTLKTAHSPGGTSPTAGPYISSITPGTGFSVVGTAGDVSVLNYKIVG